MSCSLLLLCILVTLFPSCLEQVSSRFHHLLVYAVERNWCALVRKMLDIAFENDDWDATFVELSEMLDGANLLHRAVRNRSRSMVELLLDFLPAFLAGMNDSDLEGFKRRLEFRRRWGSLFKADMRGPGGLTPLHIAASMKDAEDVVDALISGSFQVSAYQYSSGDDVFYCVFMMFKCLLLLLYAIWDLVEK